VETQIETLRDFLDEFWVVCPSCRWRAIVRRTTGAQLTCSECGHIETLTSVRQMRFGDAVDSYFLQPLWLQTDCCGEVLWAYNPRHLRFLRDFVAEKLRDVGPPGRRNLGNKLPKWMLLAKNREEVLKGISRLEQAVVA
jgi:hypothetical protein